MGIQFGRWNFDGLPASSEEIEAAKGLLSRRGTQSVSSYSGIGVEILYRALPTTEESLTETQPHILPSGVVVTWDGRLDNRDQLVPQLNASEGRLKTDVDIAAAAYSRWGVDCFAKLIGDWAISIWDPGQRCLVLARDPIGTRHLSYRLTKDDVSWSTILDPLVLLHRKNVQLDDEYIAGLLGFFPSAHLTPFAGVHSVSPSCYARIRFGSAVISRYWDFDSTKKIRYRTDEEYEHHFRHVFRESVRRRLRSHKPVLAELSGGMDSSSVVCMADTIIAGGAAQTPRLETVSYFSEAEPQWNEQPYFSKVEEKRGRAGCHIEVYSGDSLKFDFDPQCFAATPTSAGLSTPMSRQFAACLISHDSRVVLSGIGGDEVMGGVPTPTAQLADLLAMARFATLARQLKAWALATRKPIIHHAWNAMSVFLPGSLARTPEHKRAPLWLNPHFCERNRAALEGYQARMGILGALPTFQENLAGLEGLRRQLSCSMPAFDPEYERRYPYLDRDLLEFIFSIPPEQVLRPTERRSLMRRALTGIVPDALLSRRQKAVVVRGPMLAISEEWNGLVRLTEHMRSASLGIVEPHLFRAALERAKQGKERSTVPLLRAIGIELWLRHMALWNLDFDAQAISRTIGTPGLLRKRLSTGSLFS